MKITVRIMMVLSIPWGILTITLFDAEAWEWGDEQKSLGEFQKENVSRDVKVLSGYVIGLERESSITIDEKERRLQKLRDIRDSDIALLKQDPFARPRLLDIEKDAAVPRRLLDPLVGLQMDPHLPGSTTDNRILRIMKERPTEYKNLDSRGSHPAAEFVAAVVRGPLPDFKDVDEEGRWRMATPDRIDPSPCGSAVYLGGSCFVTAKHVITGDERSNAVGDYVYWVSYWRKTAGKDRYAEIVPLGNFKAILGSNLEETVKDDNRDLVVFKTLSPNFQNESVEHAFRPAVLSSKEPKREMVAGLAGYPLKTQQLRLIANEIIVKFIPDWRKRTEAEPGQIMSMGDSFQGMSGGALIDLVDNTVIGIFLNQGGLDRTTTGSPNVLPAKEENAFAAVYVSHVKALMTGLLRNGEGAS